MRRNHNNKKRREVDLAKVVGRGYNAFWHDKHFYRCSQGLTWF